jgi:2-amino-4-hydroxy-6-hydroxymethyldihydropteridine diphosphokinase
MSEKTTAYIALGSNLGDREQFIKSALRLLAEDGEITVVRASDISETTALAQSGQSKYLNAVAELETTLSAQNLYSALAEIEVRLGRERNGRWSPRTIDLDLLLFGQEVVKLPHLAVPHCQMHLRSFVLSGLCQLNPTLVHPVLKEPIHELARRLNGTDFMPESHRPQLISVAGIIGVGKTTLALSLADALDCEILLEPYDTNPYLADVYAGKKDLALNSQLYFLTARSQQLDSRALAPGQIVVSDYVFDQDAIYARRLLDTYQFDLYEKIHSPVAAGVSKPVLVLYMQDSAEKCVDRIRKRNRPYERSIGPHFLESLNSEYEQLFADWKTCPVIRLPVSDFDCTCDRHIEQLVNQIRCYVIV